MVSFRPLRVLLMAVLVLLLSMGSAQAQAPASAPTLQSPAAFLGYELGDRFTPQHRVQAYVEHVAAASDQVALEPYGMTNQGWPLYLAYVSTPERLERREEVRLDHLRSIGMEDGAPTGTDEPVLVWLSYGVHGNESVSTEAALQTLYALADPANARTQRWLADALVILDPNLNPDGRERYVQWFKRTVGAHTNVRPEAREHNEPWPGGRSNHYYFDLNRDWAWATQLETQQRLRQYNRWMPHVHVDFHEMGVDAPYFFAPAAAPIHPRISDWQRSFQRTIGDNHRRYFDGDYKLYFTREVFDLIYPGYGDTWPTFNGAIGMTYEQGGSGRAGLGIITAEGDTLTLADRIENHHVAGLSTVEATANNRAEVVQEFRAFFDRTPDGPFRSYVVKPGHDTGALDALAAHLDRQGLQYGFATQERSARGMRHRDRTEQSFQVERGDLIVSTDQPKATLANVLFEPEPTLPDSLTYDITAWALPYAYGLEGFAVRDNLTPDVSTRPDRTPHMPDDGTPYAYLVRWDGFANAQFLSAILQEDLKLRFATESFRIDGNDFPRGSLILTRTHNAHRGAAFDETIRSLARAHQQDLYATATGFVEEGSDFGSNTVPFLERPTVAIVSGAHASSLQLGAVWHFFDQQLQYPATLINGEDLGRLPWADYDVLVLPDGSYSDVLSEARMEELMRWIRGGGRVIAMGRAAAYLSGQEGFGLERKEAPEAEEEMADRLRVYGDREREGATTNVTGAIFRTQVDATHPLGFGMSDRPYFSLKRGNQAFAFLENGWNAGVVRAGSYVSGFVGSDALPQLEDTLVFGSESMGRGRVIYMIDDPLFRGFWYNGRLLLSNAVFFGGV